MTKEKKDITKQQLQRLKKLTWKVDGWLSGKDYYHNKFRSSFYSATKAENLRGFILGGNLEKPFDVSIYIKKSRWLFKVRYELTIGVLNDVFEGNNVKELFESIISEKWQYAQQQEKDARKKELEYQNKIRNDFRSLFN